MEYIFDNGKVTDEGVTIKKMFSSSFIPFSEISDVGLFEAMGIKSFMFISEDGTTLASLRMTKDILAKKYEILDEIRRVIKPEAKNFLVNGQYIMHCNSCDKLIFYSPADIENYKSKSCEATGDAIGAFASSLNGNVLAANQFLDRSEKAMDKSKNPIFNVFINKTCPYCNSNAIEFMDEDDYRCYLKKHDVSAEDKSEADEIRKYKTLLDDGIITNEEFELKKRQLLGL